MNARLESLEVKLKDIWINASQGDASSYTQLLHELSQHLRVFLKRRLHQTTPQDIEDLVQEVLLAIHQKRHTYQSEQPFTAWVFAIARYKLIDHLRVLSRRESQEKEIPDWEDEMWGYDPNETSETIGLLNNMLSELPDKQRLPIEHTKLEGRSVAEAAQLTGQTEASVKVNIHRGLKDLRELAKKRGTDHENR
jgi:RNA polymerase sigma-70 factor (ECF subfamily)